MEKVCVAWWRDPDGEPASVDELLAAVDDPGVRAATVHVEAPEQASLRYGVGADDRLLTALLSLWLDSYQDLPSLPAPGAAWLVTESVPTSYGESLPWQPGARSPGLTLVTLLDKPAGLEEAEFYRYWHEVHRVTTAECHPFTSYVRNEVVRSLTPGARPARGIVAESSPQLEDFLDPHRFYVSGGDPQRLRANQKRVFGEVSQFIDMATIEVAPMAEYVVRRLAPTSP